MVLVHYAYNIFFIFVASLNKHIYTRIYDVRNFNEKKYN